MGLSFDEWALYAYVCVWDVVCPAYVQDLVCVTCWILSVLFAVFSQSYVRALVCVMCSLQSLTSSLRSEHASLRSVGKGPTRAQGKGSR